MSLLPYYGCWNFEFTNWDDDKLVLQNPLVQELTWRNVVGMFTQFTIGHYNPLVLLSFAFDAHWHGMTPGWFHVHNLVLHGLNSLLLLAVARQLCPHSRWVAFWTAALFAAHPLRVESVAWITERKTLLYAPFFLGGLWAYCRYCVTGKLRHYTPSLALILVSMLVKAMAITVPFILLLVDWRLGRPINRRVLLEKVPFLIGALLFAAVALAAQVSSEATDAESLHRVSFNALIAAHGLVFYLQKTLIPTGLAGLYPYPAETIAALPLSYKVAPFILAALGGAIWFLKSRRREVVFGMLFFLLSIAPVLQLVPAGFAVAADRYTYVPHLGMLSALLTLVWEFTRYSRQFIRGAVHGLALAALAACVVLSFRQARTWRDSVSLWTQALSTAENDVMYSNRASALINLRRFDEAERDVAKAIALQPRNMAAQTNRGVLSMYQDNPEAAVKQMTEALRINPNDLELRYDRGLLLVSLGHSREAEVDLTQAVQIAPRHAKSWVARAQARLDQNRLSEAIEDARQAAALEPRMPDPYNILGQAYVALGDLDLALENFDETLRRDPNYSEAYINRGLVLLQKGQNLGRARKDLERGLSIDPTIAMGWNILGNTYLEEGNLQDAISAYDQAVRRDPHDPGLKINRARALEQAGQLSEAMHDYTEVLAAVPAAPGVLRARASVRERLGDKPGAAADRNRAAAQNDSSP